MPRRVQDIVPSDRRSIRNIPIDDVSNTRTKSRSNQRESTRRESSAASREEKGLDIPIHRITSTYDTQEDPSVESRNRISLTPPRASQQRRNSSGLAWIIATLTIIVLIAGVAFVASTYFAKATFSIIPRKIPVSISGTYIAQANPGNGVLTYELITLRGSASSTIPAVDGPVISTKAQGKVTMYNSYSTQSQRLIAGTRIVDQNGRVYRLTGSIIVPGYTRLDGKLNPGSVVVTVISDQPGQSFNISKTEQAGDFKIVAYKGTQKYDNISGRINTDITGGFTGSKKTISPSVLASTTSSIQTSLTSQLLARIKTNVPPGYTMYDNSYTTSFSAPVVSGNEPKHATVSVQGVVNGIIFKTSELVSKLAGEQTVQSFEGMSYETPGLESLTYAIANPKDFSADKKNTLIVRFKGNLEIVGVIPVAELKNKLAGIPLAQTQDVMRSYSAIIKSGSGELLPPWSKVPTNLERISIIIGK